MDVELDRSREEVERRRSSTSEDVLSTFWVPYKHTQTSSKTKSSNVTRLSDERDREKERHLQKKVNELTSQVTRLEKRVSLLKQENVTLKKKTEEQKPSEEKIKKLKKRNAELAAIARRLEEKAKQLQQENTKRQRTSVSGSPGTQDVEQVKRAFAKQRAKDLTEYAKNTMAKDRDIETLRQKCQQLTERLGGTQSAPHVENQELYSSKQELESLIKQAAKDRLRLEKVISKTKNVQRESDTESEERLQQLAAENNSLRQEAATLQASLQQLVHLERDLAERTTECTALYRQLEDTKQHHANKERELEVVIEKNNDLTQQNTALHEKHWQLEQMSRDCERLRLSLSAAEEQCQKTVSENTVLQQQVTELRHQANGMKDLEEQRRQLEVEQTQTLEHLKQKQLEIDKLKQSHTSEQIGNKEVITDLQSKLRELERKYELQAIQHEELSVEMEELRKEAEIAKFRPKMHTIDIQTDKSKSAGASPLTVDNITAATISPTTVQKREAAGSPKKNVERDLPHEVRINKKVPFQVYVAKYNYDPEQYSPNENPDAELSLVTGDYIFVYGTADEDGFFEGETMDGIRGLVPSNFVEKVPEKDLEDFHASIGLAAHADNHALSNVSLQNQLDFDSSEDSIKLVNLSGEDRQPGVGHDLDFNHGNLDLFGPEHASITFGELDGSNQDVPCPTQLQLERQLHNSVVISWMPPESFPTSQILEYHIFVDDVFNMSVKSTDRTKALIEGIAVDRPHRICVRIITTEGHSTDEQCTIVFGKGALPKPSDLKVSNVTASSAVVSWFPSNSNIDHRISVGNQNSAIINPGVSRCLLSGLVAGCHHQVTVTTGADQQSRSSNTASTSLRTLDAGIPDAPIDVQVEAGPKQGTLLVTWLPVTITTTGMSNGAFVTGYNIYVDGQKVQSLSSPTGDHVMLEASGVFSDRCSITVRTQAIDQESSDSHPVRLTADLLHEVLPAAKPKSDVINMLLEQESSIELSDIAEVEEIEDDKSALPRRGSHLSDRGSSHYSPRTSPTYKKSYMDRPQPNHDNLHTAESRRSVSPQNKKIGGHMTVPHIEITKDSSCSFSDPDNYSDENVNGHSSVSGMSGQLPARDSPDHHYQYSQNRRDPRMYNTDRGYGDGTDMQPVNPNYDNNAYDERDYEEGANHDIHNFYQKPTSRNTVRQKEKEYNERNTAKSNQYSRKHGAHMDNNNKPDRDHHGHPISSSRKDRSRKSPSHDSHNDPKSRDYFDKRTRTPHYEEDSSYSQLEDNNALTSKGIRDDIPLSELIDYEDDGGESLVESMELEYDEHQVRIFIALFDYDPSIMSPNPDAMDEELCFKEGQLIKVYGEKDADGFFLGESQGRRGFVPCNMVSEVEVDDPDVADQLMKESGRSASRTSKSTSRGTTPGVQTSATKHKRHSSSAHGRESSPNTSLPPLPPDGPTKHMFALYPYDPHDLSPNVDSELELAFVAGDQITVYGDMDEDGFYYGELKGRRGLVPSNFLEEIKAAQRSGNPSSQDSAHYQQASPRQRSTSRSRQSTSPVPDHHSTKSSPSNGDLTLDKNRNDKVVTFVPPGSKPQRPSPPASNPTTQAPANSVKVSSNSREPATKSTPAAVPAPSPPAPDSPPASPHNILNLDINSVKEKKKGFFSRGIFKKITK